MFRELARRPGLQVLVEFGTSNGIPNVAPDGFNAVPVSRWERAVAGRLVSFQAAEWTSSSPDRSDVVVFRWSPRSLSLLPALLRARARGVGTVLWGHGYSKRERNWWRTVRNWLAKQASALVFYDPIVRESFIQDGWSSERLFVALNSLDNTEIDQSRSWWLDRPELLAKFRLEHGLESSPVILFVSRLSPDNRLELLVEATATLVREGLGVKTVIIGRGADERQRLQLLSASLAIQDNIIFVDGIYNEIELAPWFLTADVFCYPANVGLSLLHAFWYGLPVVTSDNRAIQNPEIVALEHGVNGLTYRHGDATSLAEALRSCIVDREMRRSFSDAARRTVEDRFTIQNMVDGLEAAIRFAYQEVQSSRP